MSVGPLIFFFFVIIILLTGGLLSINIGKKQNSPLIKGIGVAVLWICGIVALITAYVVYLFITHPDAVK